MAPPAQRAVLHANSPDDSMEECRGPIKDGAADRAATTIHAVTLASPRRLSHDAANTTAVMSVALHGDRGEHIESTCRRGCSHRPPRPTGAPSAATDQSHHPHGRRRHHSATGTWKVSGPQCQPTKVWRRNVDHHHVLPQRQEAAVQTRLPTGDHARATSMADGTVFLARDGRRHTSGRGHNSLCQRDRPVLSALRKVV